MFALLRFLDQYSPFFDDAEDVRAERVEAEQVIINKLMPLLPHLLRSFDPATIDAKTGNNALHQTCRLFCFFMADQCGWRYELVKQFIAHGVSVHTRNKAGRTPLLEFAATALLVDSAVPMRLLLAHGADLNTQDKKGNSVLHCLIKADAVELLKDLCAGDEVSRLDCFISNSSGQNPFDLVAERLEKDPTNEQAQDFHRLLKNAQTALWAKHTRPLLLKCLMTAMIVPDLAELALGFLDGSSRPSDHVATQTDDDHHAAAAAARL